MQYSEKNRRVAFQCSLNVAQTREDIDPIPRPDSVENFPKTASSFIPYTLLVFSISFLSQVSGFQGISSK